MHAVHGGRGARILRMGLDLGAYRIIIIGVGVPKLNYFGTMRACMPFNCPTLGVQAIAIDRLMQL